MTAATAKGRKPSLLNPIRDFIHTEQSGGIMLLASAILALVLANSPLAEAFHHFLMFPIGISIGSLSINWPLEMWVNDGLMAVFFLVVGLEIKREVLEGHLSDTKTAMMPVIAAVGGMLVPALLYLGSGAVLGQVEGGANGWGVPMATDIAFSLAIMSLLGNRVPIALKVFLTALAIADDLGAVVVIAIFYTSGVKMMFLAAMAALVGIMLLANRMGVKNGWLYLVGGILLWIVTYKSGVHATIAGVLLALCLPFRSEYSRDEVAEMLRDRREDLNRELAEGKISLSDMRHEVQNFARNLQSMSHRLVSDLHSAVSFLIMPLFALCNTAVHLDGSLLGSIGTAPSVGIMLGLLLGKPLGIVAFSWVAVKTKLGKLPAGSTWNGMLGAGLLAGIGFTMSFFVSMLAFPGHKEIQDLAKIAILIASTTAGAVGYFWMRNTRIRC